MFWAGVQRERTRRWYKDILKVVAFLVNQSRLFLSISSYPAISFLSQSFYVIFLTFLIPVSSFDTPFVNFFFYEKKRSRPAGGVYPRSLISNRNQTALATVFSLQGTRSYNAKRSPLCQKVHTLPHLSFAQVIPPYPPLKPPISETKLTQPLSQGYTHLSPVTTPTAPYYPSRTLAPSTPSTSYPVTQSYYNNPLPTMSQQYTTYSTGGPVQHPLTNHYTHPS